MEPMQYAGMLKETKVGSKGDETRKKILDSATHCLAVLGDRGTTFQRIADHCQVSQPLVVHYFKSRENIFPAVLQAALVAARDITEERLKKSSSARIKLSAYIKVSYEIFKSTPETATIYLMLYHFAAFDERYKKMNSQIKNVAVQRISAILQEGVSSGEFKKQTKIPVIAKTIHNSLTGLLLNLITEESTFSDTQLLKALENWCHEALQA